MKKALGICLIGLVLYGGISRLSLADEVIRHDDFFLADEQRHQQVNIYNGRTGTLIIHGALLASPCILETNEVPLPLPSLWRNGKKVRMIKLKLSGCTAGGSQREYGTGGNHQLRVQADLQSGDEGIFSDRLPRYRRQLFLSDGENQYIDYLSGRRLQSIKQLSSTGKDIIWRLNLTYE